MALTVRPAVANLLHVCATTRCQLVAVRITTASWVDNGGRFRSVGFYHCDEHAREARDLYAGVPGAMVTVSGDPL